MTWLQGIAVLAMTTLIIGLGVANRQQAAATDMEAEILATNMSFYVSAVETYAAAHRSQTGSIAQNLLKLPFGWTPAKAWKNQLTATQVFVYGPAPEDADIFTVLTHCSGIFGIKKAGQLTRPEEGNLAPLPASIPDGSIVFMANRA